MYGSPTYSISIQDLNEDGSHDSVHDCDASIVEGN